MRAHGSGQLRAQHAHGRALEEQDGDARRDERLADPGEMGQRFRIGKMEKADESVDARPRVLGKDKFGMFAPDIGQEQALVRARDLDVAVLKAGVEHGLGGRRGKAEVQQALIPRVQMRLVESGYHTPQCGIFRQAVHTCANSGHILEADLSDMDGSLFHQHMVCQ